MREGFDREMDSLLRRRGRGMAESYPWGDGAGDGFSSTHLDADELSAFAEGALPAPARVMAASHLADCERCRGVVVGLARVAGAGVEVKQTAVAVTTTAAPESPPAWRSFFASLFAPRVMRFAVPVLALSLVGVVSYIALRSDKGSLQAAKEGRRENAAVQSAPSATGGLTVANANTAPPEAGNANVPRQEPLAGNVRPAETGGHGAAGAGTTVTEADKAEAQPSTEATSPPPPPPPAAAAPAVVEGPREVPKSAPASKVGASEEAEVAKTERERTESRDNKSASGADTANDAFSNETQRRAQQRSVNEMQMPDGSRNQSQKRAADNNAAGGYSGGNTGSAVAPRDADRAGSRSDTNTRGRAAKRDAKEKKAEDDEDGRAVETRTAAGHRFRREGGAWVDVNYKPSMRSTGVRRGTEGYRALVADVPEVGRVAEAIGGEVIVVVGGHAYRIR